MTSFDCLHDMGDPLGAARHIKQMLAPDGTWMVVEPHAGNSVTDNLNPVGRVYYSFSTFLCVPNALSQDGGYSLGAQAGEEPIRRLAADAGYTGFRRAAETPFNIVYEVRPWRPALTATLRGGRHGSFPEGCRGRDFAPAMLSDETAGDTGPSRKTKPIPMRGSAND